MKQTICLLILITLLFSSCSFIRPQVQTGVDQEDSSSNSGSEVSSNGWIPSAPFSAAKEKDIDTEELPVEKVDESSAEDTTLLTQKLVIPEGFTLARVGMTLQDMGICTTEEFITATIDGNFSEYPLIAASGQDVNRAFALEGYLFPDTYEIYSDESLESIIRRFLSHTESKITGEIRTAIEESDFTSHEIFTLASIIEKEAFGVEEMPKISSVLHNRLNEGMRLECDVTIIYVEGAIKPFIKGDIDRYNEYYNTYKTSALPAGPICNPSINAIRAALEPADTNYFFFLTDADKKYYYADNYEEHLENEISAGIRKA